MEKELFPKTANLENLGEEGEVDEIARASLPFRYTNNFNATIAITT